MAPGVSSCHYREVPPSISFSGSGFMATYQLGVAQSFLNYAPWILRTAPCVLGASAGSLVAAAVVCEMSMISIRDELLHFAKQMKAFTLGPLNPSINVFHWLEIILHKHLPSDAHRLASGRLAVAMTRLNDSKLIIMSDFQSKEDVVQALLCSCFVPGYCGMLPPSFKGVHYVDGGFSSMQPVLPLQCSQILTVSPFSGEMDICPADRPSMLDIVVSGSTLKGNMANSFRIINALYPMALETLEQAYDSGYKDAIHFLLSNDLVPYLIIHKGPANCNQTKTLHLEGDIVEEEKMKKTEEDITTLTSVTDDRCSTEHEEITGNQKIKEPAVHFDMVKNVLLGNMLIYVGMFGLPVRILSLLLLPLVLLFKAVLQSRNSLEFMVWACYVQRHFLYFFYSIFVCSLKKNITDRIVPIILVLHWVKIQAEYKDSPWKKPTTPCCNFPSSAHSKDVTRESLYRWLITKLQVYRKRKLQ